MDADEIKRRQQEAVNMTNVAWLIADMLDMEAYILNDLLAYIGKQFGQKNKQNFQKLIKAAMELKPSQMGLSKDLQWGFGYESDMLLQILLAVVDRTDKDPMLKLRFYEYIKSFPSQLGLDLERYEKQQFGHLTKENKNE